MNLISTVTLLKKLSQNTDLSTAGLASESILASCREITIQNFVKIWFPPYKFHVRNIRFINTISFTIATGLSNLIFHHKHFSLISFTVQNVRYRIYWFRMVSSCSRKTSLRSIWDQSRSRLTCTYVQSDLDLPSSCKSRRNFQKRIW